MTEARLNSVAGIDHASSPAPRVIDESFQCAGCLTGNAGPTGKRSKGYIILIYQTWEKTFFILTFDFLLPLFLFFSLFLCPSQAPPNPPLLQVHVCGYNMFE